MNIIPLSEKYLEETIKMVSEVFSGDVDAEWSPDRSFRSSLESKSDTKVNYWIVLGDDPQEVIGVTGLYHLSSDPEDLVWLGWYCIRVDQRAKGLGKELLEWTISKAREEGYHTLKLYTSTDPNEALAQELYEKLGFKIVGEKDNKNTYKTLYREKIL